MAYKSPKLGQYLAKKNVIEYFSHDVNDGINKIDKIKSYIAKYSLNDKDIKKIYLKLLRMEINKKIVGVALQAVPTNHRRHIQYKYKDKKSLVWISMQLNVSRSCLVKIENEFLEQIDALKLYRLRSQDAYNKVILVNMINILDQMIETVLEIDNQLEVVSEVYLHHLYKSREKFAKTLYILNDYIVQKDKNLLNEVIYALICDPFATQKEIASRCCCDNSVVSRQVAKFQQQIEKYL